MTNLKYEYDSDQEISENHSKLIDAVKQFDKGQRVRKPCRSEPSLEVSEYHLVKGGITNQNAVEIQKLAETFKEDGHHTGLCTKNISGTKIKTNILPKPVERQTAERLKRAVGFQNSKKELTRWTGITARNRTASSITFPLSQSSMKLESTNDYVKRFHLRSELEHKLLKLDPIKNIESENDFPLTLQEISQRRKEAAKFRAQQSYKEAKAHRQNKIKSKKFHRIQRKEKIKKALKEFDKLQKTDPQAALEKLEELEKTRIIERMTLRHKSTGQWAKSRHIRAKYDNISRQMLAEQLSISRELTQKTKLNEDSEEDDDNQYQQILFNSDKDNPWIKSATGHSEVKQFVKGYQKYWNKINQTKNGNLTMTDSFKEYADNSGKNNQNNNEVCLHENLFEKVKEENLPNESNKCEEKSLSKNKNNPSEKKIYDNLKDKLDKGIFKKDVKIKTFKERSGTSCWLVSSAANLDKKSINEINNIDIDDIFESVNEKLQKKLMRKRTKFEGLLDQETKSLPRIKNKKRKDISTSDLENLALKGQTKLRPIIDKPIEETKSLKSSNINMPIEQRVNKTNCSDCVKINSNTMEIDPNKFMNSKSKYLETLIPDNAVGDEALDNEVTHSQQDIISEAFADDNIVEEFRDEKFEEIKQRKLENVDLNLPGWGNWGGKDIKLSSRKKQRFIINIPRQESRRDENKGDIVVIEEKCPKIKQHLVSELPFPFTSVKDFEASMRAPLGREFVPEKIFNKLIQPAIKTKMGKVIEPMTENMLVQTEHLKKRKKVSETNANNKKSNNKRLD